MISQTIWSNINLSLKYQRFTTSGSKDIEIRKSEFMARTQIAWTKKHTDTQQTNWSHEENTIYLLLNERCTCRSIKYKIFLLRFEELIRTKKNKTNKRIEQFFPSGFKEHKRLQHNFQQISLPNAPTITLGLQLHITPLAQNRHRKTN